MIQLGNWFTYNDIENIKKMYKDGKSFEEIANVIGCTAIAIETTLRSERIISLSIQNLRIYHNLQEMQAIM